MDSDERQFNASIVEGEGGGGREEGPKSQRQSPGTRTFEVSPRRAEAESNRVPPAYQPITPYRLAKPALLVGLSV